MQETKHSMTIFFHKTYTRPKVYKIPVKKKCVADFFCRPNVCAFEELLPGGGEFALYRERYLQPTDNRQLQLRTCGQNTLSQSFRTEFYGFFSFFSFCFSVQNPEVRMLRRV